jgi:hypothetical protein
MFSVEVRLLGILDKIKSKDSGDEILPPPPPQHKAPVDAKPTLPPLPDSPSVPDAEPEEPELEMPESPGLDDIEFPDEPEEQEVADAPLPPPLPIPTASEPPKASATTTRKQIRSQFSDMPPIKVSSQGALLTDEHAKDLDVDQFVLPGEEVPPPPKDEPSLAEEESVFEPEPAGEELDLPSFEGPLYIDIVTFEDVQGALKELGKQLHDAGSDLKKVKKSSQEEDHQYGVIVSKLEKIQDDILRIDKDLFEER